MAKVINLTRWPLNPQEVQRLIKGKGDLALVWKVGMRSSVRKVSAPEPFCKRMVV